MRVLLNVVCGVLEKNRGPSRGFLELVPVGNERNADCHGSSFFDPERFDGNQNAIAKEGANLPRREGWLLGGGLRCAHDTGLWGFSPGGEARLDAARVVERGVRCLVGFAILLAWNILYC